MSVTQRLQIGMALLVVLGTLLLGLGQPSPMMPLLAIFAAVTSLIFTDFLRWFCLHRLIANLAAVGAAFFTLWNFFRDNSQEQLLAIANLLSILLIILLYQEKNVRLYWQLSVLSLLQVVVAAALTLGPMFGLLLVAYTLVAIASLALFFVYRETQRLAEAESSAAITYAGNGGGERSRQSFWRTTPPVAFQPLDRGAFEQPFLKGGLFWQVASVGFTTLVFAMILFYAIPRSGVSAWQGPAMGGQRISGFSGQVSLDQMGEILQNREPVMRVSFFDAKREKAYPVDAPYFRGAVLTDYHFDGNVAQWGQSPGAFPRSGRRIRRSTVPPNLVRQEVVLSTSGLSVESSGDAPPLFSVYPFYPLPDTPESLRFDGRNEQLFRLHNDVHSPTPSDQYHYVLGTSAFREGLQSQYTPHEGAPLDGAALRRVLRIENSRYPRLKETARRLLLPEEGQNLDRRQQALALEEHFLEIQPLTLGDGASRPYRYSLRPADVERDQYLDPIEDFVANHRSGHCEYFASALVMMLRSQGIPARLVLGYKGGEYNALGDYWLVRQLHAHAWVEAYLEPEDVPAGALAEGESMEGGAWLRLDPTPAADLPAATARSAGLIGLVSDVFDYAQLLWTDYVVGLNSETQKRALFPPVETDPSTSLADVLSLDRWQKFFVDLARSVGLDLRQWPEGQWFSWRAGVAAMILSLAFVGMFRAGGWIFRRLMRGRGRRQTSARFPSIPTVPFYQRLLAILARRGMERRPEQTQREFAAQVAAWLAPLPAPPDAAADQPALAMLPVRIVEDFYRVRFGQTTLDKSETDQIEQALTKLELSLDQHSP